MSRSIAVLLIVLVPAFAPAQDPGGVRIVDATVSNGEMSWAESRTVPVAKTVAVEVELNGKKVIQNKTVTVYETLSVMRIVKLKSLRVTDATGKMIGSKKLEELLKEAAPVVLVTGPVPETHRALFKDKTLFVELPAPTPAPIPGPGPLPVPAKK